MSSIPEPVERSTRPRGAPPPPPLSAHHAAARVAQRVVAAAHELEEVVVLPDRVAHQVVEADRLDHALQVRAAHRGVEHRQPVRVAPVPWGRGGGIGGERERETRRRRRRRGLSFSRPPPPISRGGARPKAFTHSALGLYLHAKWNHAGHARSAGRPGSASAIAFMYLRERDARAREEQSARGPERYRARRRGRRDRARNRAPTRARIACTRTART